MMSLSTMVRRAFVTETIPKDTPQDGGGKNTDACTDSSRDSIEVSTISTPQLLNSSNASTAPSELEVSKYAELEFVTIASSRLLSETPKQAASTPASKSHRTPASLDTDRRRSGRDKKVIASYNASILSGNAVHTRRAFRTDSEYSLAQVSRSTAAVTLVSDAGEWVDRTGRTIPDSVSSPAHPKSPTDSPLQENPLSRSQPAVRKSGRLPSGRRSMPALIATRSTRKQVPEEQNDFGRSLRPRKRAASVGPEELQRDAKRARPSSPQPAEPVKKKEPEPPKKRSKQWLATGLYAGQTRIELNKGKKEKSAANKTERTILPLPMFTGELLLKKGRDFALPYEILNPLRKTQAPAWTNLKKNRFVGEALPTWKRKDHSTQSQCNCNKESKCDSNCLNRSMRYECNEDNCPVGAANCQNRAFQELKWRSKNRNLSRDPAKQESNMWGIGIEVIHTPNRGHGVRSMRSFEPYQAICEYTGEIITQDEADRRMNEDYKGKTDYYLMTFHEGLIIDATKGSICRFVNHSCEPNCHVEKWVVNGEPRMALFANEDGIKVGEELTYDYNFAPYSQKNVQVCLCGAETCRGVLGPRSIEQKASAKVMQSKNGARTPSLSPKKKSLPKNQPPVRPNAIRRHTAPAVAPMSRVSLVTQQKSRAQRALKRSNSENAKLRRKKVIVPPAPLTKRQKSLKTANAVAAREKQIRRTISEPKTVKLQEPVKAVTIKAAKLVKSKPSPARVAKVVRVQESIKLVATKAAKSKQASAKPTPLSKVVGEKNSLVYELEDDSDDPFDFPVSPSSALRSRRQSKPSPKALQNSMLRVETKIRKNHTPTSLRHSLPGSMAMNAAKRAISTPTLSAESTPSSRISKRKFVPSPKARENADPRSVIPRMKKVNSTNKDSDDAQVATQRSGSRTVIPSPKARENADTSSALGGLGKQLSNHLNLVGKAKQHGNKAW